ncbi:MAG: lysylphosphatidylglycerol synthase transmembrane domain-containing protein [Bacteroidales bacterium]|nr:lysylphosphatidylglycerol synthase transmembrane domain-containing protein [Bacteroidales bacterium]MDD4829206.1 lysylphosphatidylglycerol synthase transmembrane domain-containing protein [Bacteroidales bacterium]
MSKSNPLKLFSFNRVIVPLIIGIGVAIFLIAKDFSEPIITEVQEGKGSYYWIDANNNDAKEISELHLTDSEHIGNVSIDYQKDILKHIVKNWTWSSTICLLVAMFFAVMRDLMYMYRIRFLSDNQLSWKQSFQIIMIWEFSSAITPTVVGGSAVAFFIVSMEGIGVARSTAIVMITALLDELFYIIIAPLTILFVGANIAFIHDFDFNVFGFEFGVITVFFIGYSFMCLLTIIILLAIFIYPKAFKNLLYYLSTKKMFSKTQAKLQKIGDDVITSSIEFKGKSFLFWIKAYLITISSWISRFLVVNFLILAFTSYGDQLLIFARQLVMWIILCISPTPGSSGIAEFAFPVFFKEFIPLGLGSTLSVLWRLFTYYPYIILGLIVLPIWTKRVIRRQRLKKIQAKHSSVK